jgi:hypothetical protein
MPEPAIDFLAVPIDPARLERGLDLYARRIAPGRYRVVGGSMIHWVDLYTDRLPRCDCGDHLWRDQVCKHILAALLRQGDERVLTAIRALVHGLRALPAAA